MRLSKFTKSNLKKVFEIGKNTRISLSVTFKNFHSVTKRGLSKIIMKIANFLFEKSICIERISSEFLNTKYIENLILREWAK